MNTFMYFLAIGMLKQFLKVMSLESVMKPKMSWLYLGETEMGTRMTWRKVRNFHWFSQCECSISTTTQWTFTKRYPFISLSSLTRDTLNIRIPHFLCKARDLYSTQPNKMACAPSLGALVILLFSAFSALEASGQFQDTDKRMLATSCKYIIITIDMGDLVEMMW